MKRLHSIASLLVVAVGTSCSWAEGETSASVRDRQISDGGNAIVRLYVGWKEDPKAYTTVSVPLEGMDVTFDRVAQAAACELPEDAMVVVVPSDQQDAEVIDMMDDCIFGEPYCPGGRISLSVDIVPWIQLNSCLFVDALWQPIPNAPAEILLSDDIMDYSAETRLWVADSQLDENGRMTSLKASAFCTLNSFLFVVKHPDCGPVTARSLWASSNPGEDHLLYVGALPKEKWCVFLDAMGNPMPGATVTTLDGMEWESPDQSAVGVNSLDVESELCPPVARPLLEVCCFVVSDPNYGVAIVEPYDKMYRTALQLAAVCVVPLTLAGTSSDDGSIRGLVVDDEGRPVANGVVSCNTLHVPGAKDLSAFFPGLPFPNKYAKVLTDEQGRFAMHLPLANDDGAIGRPIPAEASYEVLIEAPAERGLEPLAISLIAGQEHTVVMSSKTPN